VFASRMLRLTVDRIDEMMTLQLNVSSRVDFRRRFLAVTAPSLYQSCSNSGWSANCGCAYHAPLLLERECLVNTSRSAFLYGPVFLRVQP
jgi:hypothetical protein